jgi:SAM-dependent methyltransferase
MGALLLLMDPAPASVLDLGCGVGWTSLFLARAGYDVLGLDIAADAVAIARESAAEAGLAGARFEAADYEGFTSDRAFDYALFYDSLHHAEDEGAALAAAFRALRPGGVCFALEPGSGHGRSRKARDAVAKFGVHEKDMPPARICRLGRRAGFSHSLVLPVPHDAARSVYRRDYLGLGGAALRLEKAWGYVRALTRLLLFSRSGLVVLWK